MRLPPKKATSPFERPAQLISFGTETEELHWCLHGESAKLQALIQARVQTLDSIMKKSATPEDMTLFMRPNKLMGQWYSWTNSTRQGLEQVVGWGNNTLTQVDVPKGSRGLWLDGVQGGYNDIPEFESFKKMTDPQRNERVIKVTQLKLLKTASSN